MEDGYLTENQLLSLLELNDIRNIFENISESVLLLVPVWGVSGNIVDFSIEYTNPQAAISLQTGTDSLLTVNLKSRLQQKNLSALFDIALLAASEKRTVDYNPEELKSTQIETKENKITSARALPIKAGIFLIFSLSGIDDTFSSVRTPDKNKGGSSLSDTALEELKRQRNILVTILETLPVGVWMLDENGVIKDANKKAREIWGGVKSVGPESFTVYKPYDYNTGEEIPNERRSSFKALKGISTYLEPVKIINFAGESKIILNSAVPIFGEGKHITGAIIVNQDVTNLMKISEELKMSEERYRMLFENMNEGCFIADVVEDSMGEPADFRYLEVNDSFAGMLGLNKNDIVGKTYNTLVRKISADWLSISVKAIKSSSPVFAEYHSKYFDKYFEVYAFTPVPGKVAVLLTDRTESKKAEEALKNALARLKFHVENSPLGFVEFDNEYRITAWSENAEKIFGWKAEEVIGRKISEMRWVYEEDEQIVASLSNDMLASEKTSNVNTNRNYRKDGNVIICEWYNSALIDEDGKLVSVQSMVLDVTERIHNEERLIEVLEALKRSNSDLEQFAYVASHDLQEPVRMVTSYTQMLAGKYGDKLDEKARQYIEFIIEGSKRMHSLINDLLSYSRISTRGELLVRTDLNKVMQNVLTDLRIAIKENSAEIIFGNLPEITVDPTQIRQLFQNLISNAIKFRGTSKPVVSIGCEKRGKNWVFSFQDNGIGIDQQYFERIFVIFQRLHDRETFPGTGIGLAICKKIVERHGGRIWVSSKPGEGSVFSFTLPDKV